MITSRLSICFVSFAACVAVTVSRVRAQPTAVVPRAALSDPALSPDGKELAFIAGGDVWTVAAGGGDARLLVAHPATESRPLWSPDGVHIDADGQWRHLRIGDRNRTFVATHV